MPVNVNKCRILHIGKSNVRLNYSLNGRVKEEISAVKDLGVWVDDRLSFSPHIAHICHSANRLIGLFNRIYSLLTPAIFKILYKVFIRPRLEYASHVWSPFLIRDINKLERIQRSYKVCKCFAELPFCEIMSRLGLICFENRRKRADLILTWKIIHGAVRGGRRIWQARGERGAFSINPGHAPCDYTNNWAGIRGKIFPPPPLGPPLGAVSINFTFHLVQRSHDRPCRGHSFSLLPPHERPPKTRRRVNFITERVVKLWNALPDYIVSALLCLPSKEGLIFTGPLGEIYHLVCVKKHHCFVYPSRFFEFSRFPFSFHLFLFIISSLFTHLFYCLLPYFNIPYLYSILLVSS